MTDPALSSLFPALRDESDPDRSGIGAAVPRTEDARFVLGRGRFVADIMLPGERFACFVRSVHPSARLRGLDTTQAAAAPGVVAVFTGAELAADGLGGIPWEVRPPPDGTPPGDLAPRRDLPPLGDPSVAPPQPVMNIAVADGYTSSTNFWAYPA